MPNNPVCWKWSDVMFFRTLVAEFQSGCCCHCWWIFKHINLIRITWLHGGKNWKFLVIRWMLMTNGGEEVIPVFPWDRSFRLKKGYFCKILVRWTIEVEILYIFHWLINNIEFYNEVGQNLFCVDPIFRMSTACSVQSHLPRDTMKFPIYQSVAHQMLSKQNRHHRTTIDCYLLKTRWAFPFSHRFFSQLPPREQTFG